MSEGSTQDAKGFEDERWRTFRQPLEFRHTAALSFLARYRKPSNSSASISQDMRPRAAVFVQSLTARGGERFSVDCAHALAGRGYAVDLVTLQATGQLRARVGAGVTVVNLAAPRIRSALPRFIRYLKRKQPDTVLAIDEYSHLIALIGSRFLRPRPRVVLRIGTAFSVIFSRHTGLRDRYIVPFLVRRLYRHADRIVAVSRGIADDICAAARVPGSKIGVIYTPKERPAPDRVAEAPHPWLGDGAVPVIIAVGRITEQKNLDLLVRAFCRMPQAADARLIIVGSGDATALRAMAKELGSEERVDFVGHVDDPYAYLTRADLFVLPSLWEGLPNALLEAMTCGLPAIATDCAYGPREILAPGTDYRNRRASGSEEAEFGMLVAVDDERALAESMGRMIDDPSLRARYAAKARERAAAFEPSALWPRYEEAIFPA